jgi:sterol 24-C-methyltransferase
MPELRQEDRVNNYTKRWQEDAKDDTEAHRQSRLEDYTELVNGAQTRGGLDSS